MKIILTESQYLRIMETEGMENFFSRMAPLIKLCFESAIENIDQEDFDADDFKDYKGAVLWSTLNRLEDGYIPEIIDKGLIEEFFEYMEKYKSEIKKHYKEYIRRN